MSKVVPIGCSFGVPENSARLDPSLSALLQPADPSIRPGWKSDLFLEDVDIEAETGGMALPIRALPLPPVIPPLRIRIPALETTDTEPKVESFVDTNCNLLGLVQDSGIEVEVRIHKLEARVYLHV